MAVAVAGGGEHESQKKKNPESIISRTQIETQVHPAKVPGFFPLWNLQFRIQDAKPSVGFLDWKKGEKRRKNSFRNQLIGFIRPALFRDQNTKTNRRSKCITRSLTRSRFVQGRICLFSFFTVLLPQTILFYFSEKNNNSRQSYRHWPTTSSW